MLRKTLYFLCLIDEEPRISWSNVAFLVILGKVIITPNVDWMALVTLAITCINVMHDRGTTVATPDTVQLSGQLQDLQNKISPVLDRVKTLI